MCLPLGTRGCLLLAGELGDRLILGRILERARLRDDRIRLRQFDRRGSPSTTTVCPPRTRYFPPNFVTIGATAAAHFLYASVVNAGWMRYGAPSRHLARSNMRRYSAAGLPGRTAAPAAAGYKGQILPPLPISLRFEGRLLTTLSCRSPAAAIGQANQLTLVNSAPDLIGQGQIYSLAR